MKLKTKIILSVIGTYFIINLVFTSMYISDRKTNSLNDLNKKIENISLLLNQVTSQPLYNIDIPLLETILKSFLNDPHIERIKLQESNDLVYLDFGVKNNQGSISKITQLTHSNYELGQITTFFTTKNIEEKLSNSFFQIIIYSLIISILVSIILFFLLNKLIRPISELTKSTLVITGGDLDNPIEIKSNDEIGVLATQFETMRSSLKDRLKTINNFNKTLQKEIDEKTKELLEQKNIFETLFNDSSDGILLIKDGQFIDCNNAVLKMLGYETKKEFLNIQPHEISPKYQPNGETSEVKAKRLIVECLKTGTNRFEWIHLKKTGEEIYFEIVLTRIEIHDELIIHVVWRDIEDKKILEKEVLNRNEKKKNYYLIVKDI